MHRSGYRYTPWVLEAMAEREVVWLEESTMYRMQQEVEQWNAQWGSGR